MKIRQGGGERREREWHSRTALPSPSSSFPHFLYFTTTPHYLHAWNRLGIGLQVTRKNQNRQRVVPSGREM